MLTRRAVIGFAAATPFVAFSARMAAAREPLTYQTGGGVAINGYDPVAYFSDEKPVQGSAAHATDYKEASWQFSSAGNLETFLTDPEKYGSEYGGYCAWAASQGYLAPTDPDAWTVHKGKLYLNANKRIRRRWLRDVDGNIAKGDANWPGILG